MRLPFRPTRRSPMHVRPDLAPVSLLPRSPGTLAAVLLAHAAVLALLLTQTRAPQPVALPTPLFVRLIEPVISPPTPIVSPSPPPQAPAPRRPTPPPKLPPVLTATPPVSQPVAPSAPTPAPPESTVEAPRAEPAPAAIAAPAEAPRPAPPPLVQPRFNADYLDNPKPPYPSVSRRMGEEGEVRLRVHVDAAGNAQQVEIERSSGFPRLDQAALDTVKRWRFVPARQGDQPVAAWVIVPIQFTLRS